MGYVEQRRYERIPFSTDVELRDSGSGHVCRGRSIDLSRGGIGFFSDRFIPAGTHVRITLSCRASGRPVAVTVGATVRRATTEGGGGIMGAQFDEILSPLSEPVLCELVDSRT
jgi:hypothetical protein